MAASLSLTLFLLLAAFLALVNADMSFYAIAVGQGDSCIIQCPNRKDIVIVDMGGTQPQYIVPAYITHLLKDRFHAADSGMNIHIVVSHSHTDHYGYFTRAVDSELLRNVRQVILGGEFDNYGKTFKAWLEDEVDKVYVINNGESCFGNSKCVLTSVFTGKRANVSDIYGEGVAISDPWQLCGSTTVNFTVLGANLGNTQNGRSIVLKIKYNSWSMFMSGDFEMVTPQQDLIDYWPASMFKSSYYKVAHHGAWTAKKPNLPALLDKIQPQRVYISQGHPELSKFHHPNSVTISNLQALDSIVKIDPKTNTPFVYWDDEDEKYVVVKGGMDRAIYETCPQYFPGNGTQLCRDIWIRTDGRTDETLFMAVPSEYLYKQKEPLDVN